MRKFGNKVLCFFAFIFTFYGILMFRDSIPAALSSILFAASLCPAMWRLAQRRGVGNTHGPLRILLPVLLFFTAFSTTPLSASQENAGVPPADTSMIRAGKSEQDAAKPANLTVHFLDVGQGDCTLITCKDSAMLIDAGGASKGTAIQNYLQKQGIEHIDYLILTHPDADHIGGAPVIITKFEIDTVLLSDFERDNKTYQSVTEALDYKALKYSVPKAGAVYPLGDASFTVLSANHEYDTSNDSSVCLKLSYNQNSFLFTGDAGDAAENALLKSGLPLRANVYQAGHHGGDTSSSKEFLEQVMPEYAVISCADGNDYGHPGAKTLNNLRSFGIKVFRTDEQGTIVATSDGQTITWNCSPSQTWKAGEPKGAHAVDQTDAPAVVDKSRQETVVDAAGAAPEAPKTGEGYVLNTKSKKFHHTWCDSLPSRNRKDTDMSRDAVVEKGYSPCKRCHP